VAKKKNIKKKKTGLWIWIISLTLIAAILGGSALVYKRSRNAYVMHYKKGKILLESGKSSLAVAQFRRSIEIRPDFIAARRSLIAALAERRNFTDAVTELEKAREHGLSEMDAATLSVQIHSHNATYILDSEGDRLQPETCARVIKEHIDPSMTLLLAHITDDPSSSKHHHHLGMLHSQKSHILFKQDQLVREKARDAKRRNKAEKLAELTAQSSQITSQLRIANQRSIMAYTRAIALDPENSASSRIALSQDITMTFYPKFDAARRILKPLLEKKPPNVQAVRMMIAIERSSGKLEETLEYLAQYRELTNDPTQLQLIEADVMVTQEKWAEADVILTNFMERHQGNQRAAFLKGVVLLKTDKPSEAADVLQNIFISRSMKWPKARIALAEALEKTNRFEQAVTNYQATLADIKASGVVNAAAQVELRKLHYITAIKLSKLLEIKNPKLSAEYAEKAFNAFPDSPEALEMTRAAHEKTNDKAKIEDLVILHITAINSQIGSKAALETFAKESAEMQNQPRLRILESELLLSNGDYNKAIAAFKQLSDDFPKNRTYAHRLAALHLRLGHQDKANAEFKKLAASDPSDVVAVSGLIAVLIKNGDIDGARARLAAAENDLGADQVRSILIGLRLRSNEPDEALALIKAQVKDKPKSATYRSVLADLLWKEGDTKGAREQFTKAIELSPKYMNAYRLGLLELSENNTKEAVEVFTKATQVNKGRPAAWFNLAMALHADGQVEKASNILKKLVVSDNAGSASYTAPRWALTLLLASENDLETALLLNEKLRAPQLGSPEQRKSLIERLAALSKANREKAGVTLTTLFTFTSARVINAAEAQVAKLQKILPNEPLPECWVTLIYSESGQYEIAIERFKALSKRNPGFIQAKVYLGMIYEQAKKYDDAAQALSEAIETAEEKYVPPIHLSLGRVFEAQGRYDESIAQYTKAMVGPFLSAQANNNIAWILATNKNSPTEAIPFAEDAAKLAPKSASILDTLGWVYYLSGNAEKSIKPLEAARSALPRNPTVRYHLGAAYLKVGQKDKAKAELSEALSFIQKYSLDSL